MNITSLSSLLFSDLLGGQVVKACFDGSSAASLDPGRDMDLETAFSN